MYNGLSLIQLSSTIRANPQYSFLHQQDHGMLQVRHLLPSNAEDRNQTWDVSPVPPQLRKMHRHCHWYYHGLQTTVLTERYHLCEFELLKGRECFFRVPIEILTSFPCQTSSSTTFSNWKWYSQSVSILL
jgi:hypothetical protein